MDQRESEQISGASVEIGGIGWDSRITGQSCCEFVERWQNWPGRQWNRPKRANRPRDGYQQGVSMGQLGSLSRHGPTRAVFAHMNSLRCMGQFKNTGRLCAACVNTSFGGQHGLLGVQEMVQVDAVDPSFNTSGAGQLGSLQIDDGASRRVSMGVSKSTRFDMD
ncbi:hypothetical protein HPP92_009498 [Vanilla planifolia]|uniref:Uncharacterized protein n=1 Tax=Vanilla planifolia TaxID=51239 RepID=A0A835R6N7_VANPL|nr:hypothetical protein HPP92_009498 [Vanilla planifolia]